MATTIPRFQSTQQLNMGSLVRYPDGSPIGAEIAQAGAAVSRVAERFRSQQDELQNFKASREYAAFKSGRMAALDGFEQNVGPGGVGFSDDDGGSDLSLTGKALSDWDKEGEAFIATLPPQLQERYRIQLQSDRAQYDYATAGREREMRYGYYRTELGTMLSDLEKTVGQIDPNDEAAFEKFRAEGEDGINATGLPSLEKQQLVQKWRETSAETVWRALAAQDPEAAKAALGIATAAPSGSVVDRIIGVESGGDATAKNPNSSATGAGQFTSSTWLSTVRKYEPELGAGKSRAEVLALRNDPSVSRRMVGHLANENSAALQAAGLPVTDGTIYLAHFAGAEGAKGLLQADPNATALSVLGSNVVNANPFLKNMTAGEVVEWANRKMGAPVTSSGQDRADPRFQDIQMDRRLALAQDAAVMMNRAEAEAEKQRQEAYNAQKNDLETGLFDGTKGLADIQAARDAGWLTDAGDIRALTTMYEERHKEVIALREAQAALLDNSKVWDPTDAEDKKKIDALFTEDKGQQRIVARDQGYMDNVVLPLIDRTAMIPREAKGAFLSMLRSGDGQAITWALGAMDQIERLNPEAFTRDMGEDALRKLMIWREESPFRKPEEVVEMLQKESDPSVAAARKKLEEEGRKQAATVPDADILNHFDPSVFVGGPDAPFDALANQRLRVEFDNLFSREFARTGDMERAKANTLKLLEQTWGASGITGDNRLMRFPPERYYPRVSGGHEWMAEQAAEELKAVLPEGSQFTLEADARTESEIRSGKPSYAVIARDANGVLDYVRNHQGQIARLSFDARPFEQKARMQFERDRIEREISDIDRFETLSGRGASIPAVQQELERGRARRTELRGKLKAFEAPEASPAAPVLPQAYDIMGNPTGF